MRFESLLKPGRVGTLELKNRIVMPPMASNLAAESGEVTDAMIDWYARRARGGVGLIIVEVCFTATTIDLLRILPRVLRADDPGYIPGLTRLAKAIHENGAMAAIQLTAGGGAQAMDGPWIPGTRPQAISPSGVPALGFTDQPRVLKTEEIRKIVEWCGSAASNVKKAGFDLIEIHAHSGYLITQFLSPYFNKRTDEYGGSLDNRCRFLLEIVASMKKAIGPDFPLTVKFSVQDYLPGGWDLKQSEFLAKKLESAGVNGIGISSGVHEGKMPSVPPYFYPRGSFLPFAEIIRKLVGIPVFVGGRLNDPRMAEKVLKEGKTDFVYEGRALIADPDWPQKIAMGQLEEIRPCLACNECLRHIVQLQQPITCAVNAVAGREGLRDLIKPAAVKKKVMVVGGGPAGMEAARIAALRGHQVILCERRGRLGGLMLLGGVHNEQVSAFVKWMVAQTRKLPAEIRLRTEVTPALVKEIQPDVVILAIGGTFVTPKVPGIDGDNVLSARDLLNLMYGVTLKKGIVLRVFSMLAKRAVTASTVSWLLGSQFPIGKKVAIIGGQFPGCSLALLLLNKRKKVTIIEESDRFGKDLEPISMAGFIQNAVKEGNLEILTSAKIDEINDKGVVLTDARGDKALHEADKVIIALDLAPSDSNLAEELKGTVKEVYTIGDAKSFGRITDAVSEGYVTAYNL